jgi:hypothetical protein
MLSIYTTGPFVSTRRDPLYHIFASCQVFFVAARLSLEPEGMSNWSVCVPPAGRWSKKGLSRAATGSGLPVYPYGDHTFGLLSTQSPLSYAKSCVTMSLCV